MTDGVAGSANTQSIHFPAPVDVAQAAAPAKRPGGGSTTHKGAAPPAPSEPAKSYPEIDAPKAEKSAVAAVTAYETANKELAGQLRAIDHSKLSPHEKALNANRALDHVELLWRSARDSATVNLKAQQKLQDERAAAGGAAKGRLDRADAQGKAEAQRNYDLAAAKYQDAIQHVIVAEKLLARAETAEVAK